MKEEGRESCRGGEGGREVGLRETGVRVLFSLKEVLFVCLFD